MTGKNWNGGEIEPPDWENWNDLMETLPGARWPLADYFSPDTLRDAPGGVGGVIMTAL